MRQRSDVELYSTIWSSFIALSPQVYRAIALLFASGCNSQAALGFRTLSVTLFQLLLQRSAHRSRKEGREFCAIMQIPLPSPLLY